MAARACGLEASGPDVMAMASFLAHLEAELEWPRWAAEVEAPRGAAAPVPPAGRAWHGPSAAREAGGSPDIEAVVEEALSRASLASDGGAFTWIGAAEARAAVRERVGRDGPLSGFTLAVKDLIALEGRPLRAGSAVRDDAEPEARDAPVVAALRAAGAVLVGTTVCHEFAFGPTGVNDHAGTARNPFDRARIAGGSSSGSALAVAEGSARVALGTDTGGSIRIPAALCGVVGFKPRHGTYPVEGVYPLSPSLDHVGAFARSVADVVTVHRVLGHTAGAARPTRAGVIRAEIDTVDHAVGARLDAALTALSRAGCALVDVDWPSPEESFATSNAVMYAEAGAIHRWDMLQRASLYGADVRARLLLGMAIPATAYVGARRRAAELTARVGAVLDDVDCVVGPAAGMVAPTVEEARDPATARRLVAHTRLGNVVGFPSLSVPVPGPGLPVGIQVTAADNARALAAAASVESALSGLG